MSISDQALKCLWAALRRPSRGLEPSIEHFEALLQQARDALRAECPDDAQDAAALRLAVLVTWFGPGVRPPPCQLVDGLLAAVPADTLAAPAALLDFVIAHGCGRGRAVQPRDGGWSGRWDRALNALRSEIIHFVEDASRQLVSVGLDFPYEPNPAEAADFLLIRLCRPLSPLRVDSNEVLQIACTEDGARIMLGDAHEEAVPAGAKAVYSIHAVDAEPLALQRNGREQAIPVADGATLRLTAMDFETRVALATDGAAPNMLKLKVDERLDLAGPARVENWECTCGHHLCAERHRLDAWNPSARGPSLKSFVASAVKGPSPTVRTGSFTQGMLYALWSREGF